MREATEGQRAVAPISESRQGERGWLLGLGAILLLVFWTYRRALSLFFSADDLLHLQQAADLIPTPVLPWRVITQVGYFRAMLWLFGPAPPAFMLVNVALHALNCVLLAVLAGRLGLSPALRILAVALFGIHGIWFTVIGHAVVINDLLALTCVLTSFLAATRQPRASAWNATGAFSVGLLCKESILVLPAALLAWPRSLRPTGFPAARVSLLVVAATFGLGFGVARRLGAAPSGNAYELGSVVDVFHNAMTYMVWFASQARSLPDLVRSLDPGAWTLGVPLYLFVVALGASTPPTRPVIGFSIAWWLAGLLPVLALRNSTYAHYMYVAAPGMALAWTAALWAASLHLGRLMAARSPNSRVGTGAWRVAGATLVASVLALVADAMIARRLSMRLPGIDLPLDPALRSIVVAGRAVTSVGQYLTHQPTRMVIVTPPAQGRVFGARSGREQQSGARGYDLHRVILSDGGALRVFHPQVQDVRFEDRWSAELRAFDIFTRRQNAMFTGFGRGPQALIDVARSFAADGQLEAAVELMDSAWTAYPEDLGISLARADMTSALEVRRRAEGAPEPVR